jgi:cystathionine beta-lyase/cystathionine gamma-synthase
MWIQTKTVGEWLKDNYPDYCGMVTVNSEEKEPEREMVKAYGAFNVEMPPHSYKRYSYALSHIVAQNFAHSVGALGLNFSARLTNCGMAAISTILAVVFSQRRNCMVFANKVLYPETRKLLRSYREKATIVESDDLLNCLFFARPLIFSEPVGNGSGMPVTDVDGLFRKTWKEDAVVVLDNTLLTCRLLNPFWIYTSLKKELGDPKMQFIYVESLSKHYRVGDKDLVTAGIIVAPNDFIKEVDKTIMRNGAYLQFPCLEKLPFGLFTACNNIMTKLSDNAKNAAEFLRKHPKVKEVSYPDLKNGAGGILYFIVEDEEVENVLPRMAETFGFYKGSFGHPHTSWVPFGKLVDGNPKGLIRLAVGYQEEPQEIVHRLKEALG